MRVNLIFWWTPHHFTKLMKLYFMQLKLIQLDLEKEMTRNQTMIIFRKQMLKDKVMYLFQQILSRMRVYHHISNLIKPNMMFKTFWLISINLLS